MMRTVLINCYNGMTRGAFRGGCKDRGLVQKALKEGLVERIVAFELRYGQPSLP